MKSAVNTEDYPDSGRPEIAFLGRSNSGKSTLINSLLGSRQARVSSKPGKTTLLNFYDCGEHYRIVDLPGYGFASRSNKETMHWKEMIETYLQTRPNLVGAVLVMDIRRDWSKDEELISKFVNLNGMPLVVALNKTDKLPKNSIQKRLRACTSTVSGGGNFFCISAKSKDGVDDLEEHLFKNWVNN